MAQEGGPLSRYIALTSGVYEVRIRNVFAELSKVLIFARLVLPRLDQDYLPYSSIGQGARRWSRVLL
jgi:hypothetical protein